VTSGGDSFLSIYFSFYLLLLLVFGARERGGSSSAALCVTAVARRQVCSGDSQLPKELIEREVERVGVK
jgi:predicted membrane-bound dolichyl-phosphate-mannose-protein mannosyltransferase